MELRHLRYFLAVAQERNFTRAAERLGIAQPPLSRQIRELEEALGVTLFQRASRPLGLTEGGRLFLDHAMRVVAEMEQLHAGMARHRSGNRRRFVIGFVGSSIYGPVPELIRKFRDGATDVEVELVEMNTVTQMAALKDGRIDAGIGRLAFDDPNIARHLIMRERLVVAVPIDHQLARHGGGVELRSVAAYELILYPSEPRPSYADHVLGLFRNNALEPRRIREVRELQTALGLVVAQAGICVVPSAVRRLRTEDVAYRDIVDEDAASPIFLSWRATDISAEMQALREIAQGYACASSGNEPTP
ncbi:LysR family transcriptional regulator [Sphingobium sp. TA15]|uniref:LysR-family transcriptional regulator n=2 Tax=Sphingobium indicum TaxID=332055 RepID=D4Z423_SPHIU|nr:LysR family transcriptional regulator [Sphingobium indicum]NYI21945.1 DNA-binding transcriptional LysR family regulator [Sphingobium indicum]RYM03297.1 LysR family transcriptional regulator [Sphingobium indicum]BAI97355.1 LysR-family transcriptional regulator [Sphingobium indicum UT26S]BDD66771.1 LysR family transcriptional regulator [Sphingobium sp. TA15]